MGLSFHHTYTGQWGKNLSWRMKRRYYFMKSSTITAINRAIITKRQAGSSGDTNTMNHHNKGAPTHSGVTEAKTFRSAPFSDTIVTLFTNTRIFR